MAESMTQRKSKPIARREVRVLMRHSGHVVLSAKAPDGATEIMLGAELGDGQPAPASARAVMMVTKEPDGRTYVEGVELRGPAKVASPAYRSNHAAIFGPTKLERELMN